MIESLQDRQALLADDPVVALFGGITIPPEQVPPEDRGGFPIQFGTEFGARGDVLVERNALCIFSKSFIEVNGHESYHPTALFLDEDVKYLKHEHRIMLVGHVWGVQGVQPDGTGFTAVTLERLGPYLYVPDDPSVAAGFPFNFGTSFSSPYGDVVTNPAADPENPRLRYPYTVQTYLDCAFADTFLTE